MLMVWFAEWIFCELLVGDCGCGGLMTVCIRFWASHWGG